MTLLGALNRLGVNVPRYVTVDGQIVFDAVGTGGGGYTHPTHGVVTPVVKHTFHGGVEEPTDSGVLGAHWWDDPARLQRHVAAMSEAFSKFAYLEPEEDHAPCWAGEINTGRGRFQIGVTLRADEGLPSVFLIKKVPLGVHQGKWWVPSPHLYLNGNLCIADQTDWDPEVHTTATAVGWAAHWFAAYTAWRLSGGNKWPTPGAEAVAA